MHPGPRRDRSAHPAFRDSFKNRRCLVIIDGFFEWKALPDGRRVPHHIRRVDRRPFAVAGLWDSWRDKSAENPPRIESCAVVTTASGGPIRSLHDRMPLVLEPEEYASWLAGSPDDAARLMAGDAERRDERAEELLVVPVSTWVNDVRHDDPKCIEPVSSGA
jgi:putative SOS response-associated peptidase YedK